MQVTMPAQPPPTPPTPAKPEIIVLGLLNDSPLFKAGDAVRVQLQGTPQGAATISLGRLFRDQPLQEVRPGMYQGQLSFGQCQCAQSGALRAPDRGRRPRRSR